MDKRFELREMIKRPFGRSTSLRPRSNLAYPIDMSAALYTRMLLNLSVAVYALLRLTAARLASQTQITCGVRGASFAKMTLNQLFLILSGVGAKYDA